MSIETFRKWVANFNEKPLPLRYAAIVLMVYVPGVLVALHGGVFSPGGPRDCEIYFINDYAFHYSYLFAVPLSFLIMPSIYRGMDRPLNELRTLAIMAPDSSVSTWTRRWGSYSFQLLMGVVVGLLVAVTACILNYRSMVSQGREQFLWYFPRAGSYLPFFHYVATCFIAASIFLVLFLRYAHVIYEIRKAVLRTAELPTWVASSEGPIDRLFRSVFVFFLPVTTVAVVIIIIRLARGVELSDFALLWCLSLLPAGLVVVLLFPVVFSGIPRKLSLQRSELLRAIDKRMSDLIKRIGLEGDDGRESRNVEELEALIRERKLMRKNYPTWPLASITRILSGVPIGISAIPSVITGVKMVSSLFRNGADSGL